MTTIIIVVIAILVIGALGAIIYLLTRRTRRRNPRPAAAPQPAPVVADQAQPGQEQPGNPNPQPVQPPPQIPQPAQEEDEPRARNNNMIPWIIAALAVLGLLAALLFMKRDCSDIGKEIKKAGNDLQEALKEKDAVGEKLDDLNKQYAELPDCSGKKSGSAAVPSKSDTCDCQKNLQQSTTSPTQPNQQPVVTPPNTTPAATPPTITTPPPASTLAPVDSNSIILKGIKSDVDSLKGELRAHRKSSTASHYQAVKQRKDIQDAVQTVDDKVTLIQSNLVVARAENSAVFEELQKARESGATLAQQLELAKKLDECNKKLDAALRAHQKGHCR